MRKIALFGFLAVASSIAACSSDSGHPGPPIALVPDQGAGGTLGGAGSTLGHAGHTAGHAGTSAMAGSGAGASPATGGTGGAHAGSGGSTTAGTGGAHGGSGTAGTTSCSTTQHVCGGKCVAKDPSTGCGSASCTPCPTPPQHGVAVCTNDACDVQCNAPYQKSGGQCVCPFGCCSATDCSSGVCDPTMHTCCNVAAGSTCSTAPQCGCTAGLGCYLGTAGMTSCQAAGTLGLGEPCSGDGCKPGLECIGFKDSQGNFRAACVAYCSPQLPCAPADVCSPIGNTAGNPSICSISCSLMNPQSAAGFEPCGPGATCVQYNAGATTATTCAAAGSIPVGQPCQTDPECVPGASCATYSGQTLCRAWCRLGGFSDCPAGKTCVGFTSPVVSGGVEMGTCN